MKKIFLPLIAAVLVAGCAARPARAQFIGYTSPQTVQQTLATNVACTGINQAFATTNLGQNQHSATLTVSASTTSAAMFIQGQDAVGDVFPISETVFAVHTFASTPAITSSGYFPIVSVVVKCTGGTFNLNYAGTSSQSNVTAGAYLNGQIDKAIFQFASQGSTVTGPQFVTPYGSSYGQIEFQYQTAAVSGSTLAVQCVANGVNGVFNTYTFNLAAVTTVQMFAVPSASCPLATVIYTSGGASANTYSADYLLYPTGTPANTTLGSYTHVTGTTATAVKASTGTLVSLNVNTPAAGTISVFDLASANCTGTPATNVVAVITGTATAPLGTFFYNATLNNGICVKASVAMDFTVSFQ